MLPKSRPVQALGARRPDSVEGVLTAVIRPIGVVIAVLLGLVGLVGCGTKSFSNAVAVITPTRQQVSVFDQQMGESAEWAGQWLGEAAPGSPYTREVPTTDTKLIGDSSPPASVRAGIYLPDRTDTGYYSLIVNDAVAGSREVEVPFVAWYSETPVPAQPALPVTLELAPGPNGWLVNITVKDSQ